MKSLNNLLVSKDLEEHNPSRNEIEGIKRLISRDIQDANLLELSIDRRFATIYNAALNLSRIIVISKGYRITAKIGHHKITFTAASIILGKQFDHFFSLFEICRRKRNKVDYDQADVATESELIDLISHVNKFEKIIHQWMSSNHFKLI